MIISVHRHVRGQHVQQLGEWPPPPCGPRTQAHSGRQGTYSPPVAAETLSRPCLSAYQALAGVMVGCQREREKKGAEEERDQKGGWCGGPGQSRGEERYKKGRERYSTEERVERERVTYAFEPLCVETW